LKIFDFEVIDHDVRYERTDSWGCFIKERF
jgi:hypothetical protein